MRDFNPFDKDISEINVSDLQKLIDNEVTEGWFVEYKEKFIENKKIAHSIAAFANSDGGWFIIGIKTDSQNRAVDISGFPKEDRDEPEQRITDIIKTGITPIPTFKTKLINTERNYFVLITYVERGLDSPYITQDGRIYRRVNTGKNPIPESDRYSIQKLFERRELLKQEISSYTNDIEDIQPDSSNVYLESFLMPKPFNSFSIKGFSSKGFCDKLIALRDTLTKKTKKSKLPYLSISSTYCSYTFMLRENPYDILKPYIKLVLSQNGNIKFSTVLSGFLFPSSNLPVEYANSDTFTKYSRYLIYLKDQIWILNAYNFMYAYSNAISLCRNIFDLIDYGDRIDCIFRVKQNTNITLFFDIPDFLDYIEKMGIPIIIRSTIDIPSLHDYIITVPDLSIDSEISFVYHIFKCLGIPWDMIFENVKSFPDYYIEQIEKYEKEQE
ncbi:ATP-binding protein [bacterium]|nr:ATP-binding protein [bacterium]